MSFIPNKQYTEGDDLSVSPIGEVVQTRDSVSGLAVPFTLGKEGVDQSTLGTGLLGWLKYISDTLGAWQDAGQSIGQILQGLAGSIVAQLPIVVQNGDASSPRGFVPMGVVSGVFQALRISSNGSLRVVDDARVQAISGPDVKTINTAVTHNVPAPNDLRSALFLRNNSTGGQTIWLAFDGNIPVVGKGISLKPSESWTSDSRTNSTAETQAISDIAGALLSIQEWSYN